MAEKPDIIPADSGLPDLAEKFAKGELVSQEGADYGPRNELIPERYQNILRRLNTKIALRDMFARIDEVRRAADGGFYWRSVFDAYFDDARGVWEWPGDGPGGGNSEDNAALSYPLNIYQARGRSFVKMVGHKPTVHFEASGDSPHSDRVASAANALRRNIEQYNDTDILAQNVARCQWTDGRFLLYTRWVTDGSKCGYYDSEEDSESREVQEGMGEGGKPPRKKKRQPRGYTKISLHDVPEAKVPVNMVEQSDFPFVQISLEIDMTSAKALYPMLADKMVGGEPGPGEFNFDRTTRIALKQGLRLVTQTGDTVSLLPTWQRTWMRPSMWSEIEDKDDREWFEDNYPDGAFVAFIGEQYCESRNESLDDHIVVGRPIVGHGQTTPSYGYSMLTAQDLFNDLIDLEMECHMRGLQSWFGDPEVFDFPAMSRQKAQPGSARPLKEIDPQIDVKQHVFVEPAVQPSQQALNLRDSTLGKISDIITGINAPVVGQSDENNPTLGGIQLLMRASRGESGMAWMQWQKCYMHSMEQAVRIEAHYRLAETDEDGMLLVQPHGSPDILVDLEDLNGGNYYCEPDSDCTYPSTFEERQAALAALVSASVQGSQLAIQILSDPRNSRVFKQLVGIPGIHVGPDDSEIKQAAETQTLLMEEPVPNLQAIMRYKLMTIASKVKGGQPPPQPDKYSLFQPSVPVQRLDDHAAEALYCKEYANSQEGQRQRRENPNGFLNLELHALAHQAQVQQAQQQAIQAQVMPQVALEKIKHPQKSPTESIAFKDLGPSGQLQLGRQAGLDLSADASASMAGEMMGQPQPAPRRLARR